jgi:hypothetical protein
MEQNPLKPVIQNLDNQRIDSPKPIQPMQPVRKPIQQEPQKPISKAQKELNEINIAQQRALELAQTGQQPAKPSFRMEREAELQNMLGKTINVGREDLRSDTPETQVVEQTTSNRNLPTAEDFEQAANEYGRQGANNIAWSIWRWSRWNTVSYSSTNTCTF